MSTRVFVDGHAGTIGLRIRELLAGRADLTQLEIAEAQRKDPSARRDMLNACDVAILCLPDEAAIEAVSLIENPSVRVIDGSTAFRVSEGWVYGLPELAPEQRNAIKTAKRVANPGCWPTCVALLTRPLIDAGLLPTDIALSIHGLSGYTGGGKPMIEKWEGEQNGLQNLPFEAPYAFDKKHKHIPEMQRYGRLKLEPLFRPAVGPFRCGMRVEISLHASQLPQLPKPVTAESIVHAYRGRYGNERFIKVVPINESLPSHERSFDPSGCNGTNRVELRVLPHPSGHVVLMAILDNLGKGASGAAVQSLNLMLGLPEDTGLRA